MRNLVCHSLLLKICKLKTSANSNSFKVTGKRKASSNSKETLFFSVKSNKSQSELGLASPHARLPYKMSCAVGSIFNISALSAYRQWFSGSFMVYREKLK